MGPFSLRPPEASLFPRLLQRARGAWEDLGRPVTLPEDESQWQQLLSNMGPVEGPFDWSLVLGAMRSGRRARLTHLGHIVEAWRCHAYVDARSALAKLAGEFVQRAHAELAVDLWAELPLGFASGEPLTVTGLVSEPEATDLWSLGWASSYEKMPPQSDVWDHALRLTRPVAGKRVLLTTPVFNRPDVASGCVHLLRGNGAAWVGLFALASDLRGE